MHIAAQTVLKLCVSAALGGVVGLEREIKQKPAGLRTNMLICLGSTIFTMLSQEVARSFHSDPERIAAQIIPGIGFIGAGAILREGMSVTGLTTAASIFVVAAIGMGIGYGYYASSVISSGLIVGALLFLGFAEGKLKTKYQQYEYAITTHAMAEASERVVTLLDELKLRVEGLSCSREADRYFLRFQASFSRRENNELMRRLLQIKELEDIKSAVVSEK